MGSRLTRYRTIVADPPWPIGAFPEWADGEGLIPTPYPTMSLEDIARLPVEQLAADRAHLYLWTINEFLPQTYEIARRWGFEPSALLVWCKEPIGVGLGGTFPSNVEFVLFCTRRIGGDLVLRLTSTLADRAKELGISKNDVDAYMNTSDMGGWWLSRLPHRCACPTDEQWIRLKGLLQIADPALDLLVREINDAKGEKTALGKATGRWFRWKRGAHSRKPEAFLDLVETVSPGPYLELFARRNRLGWDTWGNESIEHVELTQSVNP